MLTRIRIKIQMTKDTGTVTGTDTDTTTLRYYRKDGPVFDSYGEACSETGETPTVAGYQSFKKWHEYAKTRQPPSDCSCFAPRPNLGPAGPLNEFAKMARGAKMARRVP